MRTVIAAACFAAASLWARFRVGLYSSPESLCSMSYSSPSWERMPASNASLASCDAFAPASASAAPSHYALHRFVDRRREPAACRAATGGVLFVPGSGGDFRQARSLGGALADVDGACVVLFAVDFGGEATVYAGGRALSSQQRFVRDALWAVSAAIGDAPVVLVGHSLGGVIVRAVAADWAACVPEHGSTGYLQLSGVVTIATPHARPPLPLDRAAARFYSRLNDAWRNAGPESALSHLPLISISGGVSDGLVADVETNVETLLGNSGAWTWVSHRPFEHQAGAWCKEVIAPLAFGLHASFQEVRRGAAWSSFVVSVLRATPGGTAISPVVGFFAELPQRSLPLALCFATLFAIGGVVRVLCFDSASFDLSRDALALFTAPLEAVSSVSSVFFGRAPIRDTDRTSHVAFAVIMCLLILAGLERAALYRATFDLYADFSSESSTLAGVLSNGFGVLAICAVSVLFAAAAVVALSGAVLPSLALCFRLASPRFLCRCGYRVQSSARAGALTMVLVGLIARLASSLLVHRLSPPRALFIARVLVICVLAALAIAAAALISGLARERPASFAAGTLFIVSCLTWAPTLFAVRVLFSSRNDELDFSSELEGAGADLARAALTSALALYMAAIEAPPVNSATPRKDRGAATTSTAEALVVAPTPCACSSLTAGKSLGECIDIDANTLGTDCWALLPARVAAATACDAKDPCAAFADACARAARWARAKLRPGAVLLELPPSARLPPALHSRPSRLRIVPGKEWTPPLSEVKALPQAVLRPLLCDACACPHVARGGHAAAAELLKGDEWHEEDDFVNSEDEDVGGGVSSGEQASAAGISWATRRIVGGLIAAAALVLAGRTDSWHDPAALWRVVGDS
jgi:pimeloyl-ACP methyl ester carboxylesterase